MKTIYILLVLIALALITRLFDETGRFISTIILCVSSLPLAYVMDKQNNRNR